MKDQIYLGSAPTDESCVQVSDENYATLAREECNRYKELLRTTFINEHRREPECTIRIKSEKHDFGSYYEVIAEYHDDNEIAMEDAYWLESNSPEKWQ